MSAIIPKAQAGNYTQIEFDPAVALPVSGKFFVSVDFSNLCWTCTPRDTLAIASNMDGQTMPSAIWEFKSNNTWYQYGLAGASQQNASLILHPYLTNQPALATFTETATSICAGQSITFDAAGSAAQDSLVWYLEGATNAVVTSNAVTTAIYTAPGTYTAQLQVKGGGCHQVRVDTVVITVGQPPNVTVSVSTNDVCQGTPVTLTAFGAGSYTWSPATGLSTTTGSSVTCIAATTTIYTATGSNSGCSANGITQVRIKPLPLPVINQQGNTLSVNGFAAHQWLLNNQPVNNAIADTYVAAINGNYSVIVTNADGCSDTSAPVQVIMNGVKDVTYNYFNVYPNPAASTLTIQLHEEAATISKIDMCNALGQVINVVQLPAGNYGNTFTIDVSAYPQGIYILRLYNGNAVSKARVLLAR